MFTRLWRFPFLPVLAVVATMAVVAVAAPDDPAAGSGEAVTKAGVAPNAPAQPGSPEQAASAGQLAPAAKAALPPPPAPKPGSEEAALADLVAANQEEVAGLLQQLQGASDPQQALELQQEIVRVKAEGRLAFLQTKIDFARQRGDEVAAQEAMRVRDSLVNPPRPAVQPDALKPAPTVAK